MNLKGDSERQALLRDKMIKKTENASRSEYVLAILSVLKQQMKLLDIGCGTAHIIQKLALRSLGSRLVGLDVSPAMLKMASTSITGLSNVELVEGDGCSLPFPDGTFNIVITRLADYSPKEAYRVLKGNGCFLECSLAPEADREIKEFFPERIEKENFFVPKDLRKWKQEVSERIVEAGFTMPSVEDHKESNYYETEEELMDLIEMVPLVRKFDRTKDRRKINELAEKYGSKEGVKITWHYYILMARKS